MSGFHDRTGLDPNEWGWYPPNTEGGDGIEVPEDLVQHYRQVRDGLWGYVCPCCRYAMAPGWGMSIPRDFRAHIRPYLEGRGCFFEPKAQAATTGARR